MTLNVNSAAPIRVDKNMWFYTVHPRRSFETNLSMYPCSVYTLSQGARAFHVLIPSGLPTQLRRNFTQLLEVVSAQFLQMVRPLPQTFPGLEFLVGQ